MGNSIRLPNLISHSLCPDRNSYPKRWVLSRRPSFNLQEIVIVRYSQNPNEIEPLEYYHVDDITEGPLNQV